MSQLQLKEDRKSRLKVEHGSSSSHISAHFLRFKNIYFICWFSTESISYSNL